MRAPFVACLAAPYVVVLACGGAKSEPPQTASEVTIPVTAPSGPEETTDAASAQAPSASAAPSAASVAAPADEDAGRTELGMIVGLGGLGLRDADVSGIGRIRATPSIREGATQVNGRLPPEFIQRIVRQNFRRFRQCYERALSQNPKVTGRITIRFTIDRAGTTSQVTVNEATTKNRDLEQCVAHAFESISYPQPEGGVVVVVYPIDFAPPGSD